MEKPGTRERILRTALLTFAERGYHRAAVDEIVTLIRDAGFTPTQRTTEYDILRIY